MLFAVSHFVRCGSDIRLGPPPQALRLVRETSLPDNLSIMISWVCRIVSPSLGARESKSVPVMLAVARRICPGVLCSILSLSREMTCMLCNAGQLSAAGLPENNIRRATVLVLPAFVKCAICGLCKSDLQAVNELTGCQIWCSRGGLDKLSRSSLKAAGPFIFLSPQRVSHLERFIPTKQIVAYVVS